LGNRLLRPARRLQDGFTPPAQWNDFEVNIPSGLNFYPVAPEDGTGVSEKTSVGYLTGVYPVKFFGENKRSVFNWGLTPIS